MSVNQRKICYEILHSYETQNSFLNLLLKDRLSQIPSENRGFITEIVYGVVRNRIFLDRKISEYSKIKLKKLSLNVLIILRIAFYEIYFMEKTPDYAIINENVNLSKKVAYKSSGFVNGILRKGINKTEDNYTPDIKYSFPKEMYEKIKMQYGDETKEILKNLNLPKMSAVRCNTLKISKEALTEKLGDSFFCENGNIYLKGNVNNSYFKDGLYSVSGISSQSAVFALAPQKNENILDCCSAPGGKTAHIAELIENTGSITAMELHPHRCELICENLKRLGITNTKVICHDATVKKDEFFCRFDRVICDVPCSGWGVIGTKPDIKWQDINIGELCEVQWKILNTAKEYVKSGGILLYSTCTVNKEENVYMTEKFLKENSDFEKVPFEVNVDGKVYGENGIAEIMPGKNASGFYICKMRKK